jgi:hypothetical protein
MPAPVYLLEITLKDLPTVWRRIAVPATIRLPKLHDVIQAAMGWTDSHLHEFISSQGEHYGTIDEDEDWDRPTDEAQHKLNELLWAPKQSLTYIYDFGDHWEHKIVLKKIVQFPQRPTKADVIEGAGNCPPEDCGGVPGYEEMLRALADPLHPEHQQFTGWLPDGHFDPTAFDAKRAELMVRSIRV